MAKKNEPNLPTRVTPDANVPSYLTQYEGFADDMALQNAALNAYVIVPRIKIIQATSSDVLTKQFGIGTAIFAPSNALVCRYDSSTGTERSEPFTFNAIFPFTEFMKWKDINDKSDDPSIVARTFDPNSTIARRARDTTKRLEAYGEPNPQTRLPRFNYRHVEHLNFVGVITGDHPNAGVHCTLSFSRGEFSTGRNWISAVQLRKTPLWSQQWDFNTVSKTVGTKRWWGWFFQPSENPNIGEEAVADRREQYRSLKEAFDTQRLQVDHTDADVEDVGEPASGSNDF